MKGKKFSVNTVYSAGGEPLTSTVELKGILLRFLSTCQQALCCGRRDGGPGSGSVHSPGWNHRGSHKPPRWQGFQVGWGPPRVWQLFRDCWTVLGDFCSSVCKLRGLFQDWPLFKKEDWRVLSNSPSLGKSSLVYWREWSNIWLWRKSMFLCRLGNKPIRASRSGWGFMGVWPFCTYVLCGFGP